MAAPLLFGPYQTPRVTIGSHAECRIHGAVRVVGFDSRGWPIGRKVGGCRPIVFFGLLKALKREKTDAISEHWGVPVEVVSEWKKIIRGMVPNPRLSEPRRWAGGRPHVWTPEEDELVRTLPIAKAAKKIRVAQNLIRKRRNQLGIGLHDILASR